MTIAYPCATSVGAQFEYSNQADTPMPLRAAAHAVSEAKRIPVMATVEMLTRLPALEDDEDIDIEKDHVVPRDDQPDLKFRGTLLASVASIPRGPPRWHEYRVYRTRGGSFVFSAIGRSLREGERD